MGKTAAGAVWLNPGSPQPLRFLAVLAQHRGRRCRPLPQDCSPTCRSTRSPGSRRCEGQEINEAKKVLATEITALAHGREAAEQAAETARRTFEEGAKADTLPTVDCRVRELAAGIAAFELFHEAGLAASRNEARKLIKGGGARLNDKPIAADTAIVGDSDLDSSGTLKLSAGRKRHVLVRAV